MATRFVVDLGDVKVSDTVSKRLNDKIQRAVLDELAGIDLPGDVGMRFPREWLGIWIRLARPGVDLGKEFNALEGKVASFMKQ